MIKDRLIDKIYPFPEDPFGNLICFDYRNGMNKSLKVVFWDHEIAHDSSEEAIRYICVNFTILLHKLYTPE
ncbi:MAG TPA: SMI1/KNR4 family protein, partial [Clostridiales bacterium]|nr:SMI1/KNR4 family protein [Clostridiales bacterium]